MKTTWLVCLTLLIVVISPTRAVHAQEPVARQVALDGDITRIYLTGAAELHVNQGEEQYVRLTTSQAQVDKILARVRGRSLYLGWDIAEQGEYWGEDHRGEPVRYDVQLAQLDALRVRGSGHAFLGNLVARRLKLIMLGSGNIDAESIHAEDLRIEIAGSGEVDAKQIVVEEMGIEVAGNTSINIETLTAAELEIDIAGNADIDIPNLQTEELETEISGNAHIDLAGRAGTQDLEINGAGDYNTPDLVSDYVYLEIRGNGDVVVAVEKDLTAELARGAELEYYAGPDLKVDISGRGDARQVGNIRKNE